VIVLVGFMGAGKSTVGPLVAESLGLPFVDIDRTIEAAEGASVAEIFTRAGEATFRALESAAVERALDGPRAVIALGGGALGDPATCVALEWHTVVHLGVSYPEAMRRIGSDAGRPMLAVADPRALYDARTSTYQRVARHTVPTDGRSPAEVAAAVIEAAGTRVVPSEPTVEVGLGTRSYKVHVGADLARSPARFVPVPPGGKVFLITHPSLVDAAKVVIDPLSESTAVHVLTVPEGESSKSMIGAAALLEDLAAKGAGRRDVVVSFGGGVVSDLAGFVASTYHRGMALVHVPTSLLAQVDAAIGGKTAVNLPQGKNLVGTFHQPLAVICDVTFLRSLPDDELRAGLAEVIKAGLIADERLAELVAERIGDIFTRDDDVLIEIVRRSAGIKAGIVAADEREAGPREVLNYGHTFGHALEHTTSLRHGEAVAIGMMAAAHLAHDLGLLDDAAVEFHRRVLGTAGLPTAAVFDLDEAMDVLGRDKKHREGLRFVVLDAIGGPARVVPADRDQTVVAFRKVSA